MKLDGPRGDRHVLFSWACRCATGLGLVVVVAGIVGCGGGNAPEAAPEAPAVQVSTGPVERVSVIRRVRVTGTMYGDEETTIAAKVSGRVVATLVDMGDSVESGQPLARVEAVDYELAADERRQAYLEALSKLGLTSMPEGIFDVNQLPSVQRARLQAENAQSRYERGRSLAERQPPLISEQDFADLKTAWDVAQSELEVERLTANSVLAEARTLEAQVRMAEQRLADTTHRAPQSLAADAAHPNRVYEVASRMVSVGDFVQIGTPLYRLVDADPLKLRVKVPERRAADVAVGQTVGVRVDAFKGAFSGRVSRISPAVDITTRTYAVEILISNPQRQLKPGLFATAEIEVNQHEVIAVEASSIVTFAGVHKVFVVEDEKAAERVVLLGDRVNGKVEIREGLTGDETVLVKPPGSLTGGMRVIVDSTGSSAGSARVER